MRLWVGSDPTTRRALSVSARSTRRPDGTLTGAALAYKDVTDFMRALAVKDEFVGSVSHELRTPLTSVLGHLEMLAAAGPCPDDVRARLDGGRPQRARLQMLVSDLCTSRRGRRGRPGGAGGGRPALMVRESAEAARPWAKASDVTLARTCPTPGHAMFDPQRMRQVVDNLVSNGIKYNVAGGTVDVTLVSTSDSVELSVTDTGIGIAEEDLPRLFTRFHRGRVAREQQIPGTGLGLNIIRAIVEAHGGAIAVTSEPGEGTRATATFPRSFLS